MSYTLPIITSPLSESPRGIGYFLYDLLGAFLAAGIYRVLRPKEFTSLSTVVREAFRTSFGPSFQRRTPSRAPCWARSSWAPSTSC